MLSVCVTSNNFKIEDTARSNWFCDFYGFFALRGANATSFLWKGSSSKKGWEPTV